MFKQLRERLANQLKTTSGAIIIALIPAIILFGLQFLDNARKDTLARIDAQLERLYGPLYALTTKDNAAWDRFSDTRWLHARYAFSNPRRTVDDVDTWRLYMRDIFQPLNEAMADVIVPNSQLIIGDRMPWVFEALLGHTVIYKATIANWKSSDRSNLATYLSASSNLSGIRYPNNFNECVSVSFAELKQHQHALEWPFPHPISALRSLYQPIASPGVCDQMEPSEFARELKEWLLIHYGPGISKVEASWVKEKKPEMTLRLFKCSEYGKSPSASRCYNHLWKTLSVPDNSETTLNFTEASVGSNTGPTVNRGQF